MHEPQELYQRTTILELLKDKQQAELIKIRCEMMLQRGMWNKQQQQLQHDNQLLSLALLQAGAQNVSAQAQLQQLTMDCQRDALTQVLNRTIMLDRINQAVSLARRQQSSFSLLFIDLDKFKAINDQHGHAAGDAVLQQVGHRLSNAIRDSDAISRHGGDEFLVLLNNTKTNQDVSVFTNKLIQLLEQPYTLTTGDVSLSASIGTAHFPADGNSAAALISHADAAMYRVKYRGGGSVD